MPNLVDINYGQTGQSTKTNTMGMRDMQERAYTVRDAQYILLKAPPASGKSRALMFIALDKLHRQGLKKIIVSVPEMAIGTSFRSTDLTSHGFFVNWEINPEYNLCIPGGEKSKVKTFLKFLSNNERIIICTHATLRFASEKCTTDQFNDTVLAIDEFHHVSANEDSRLGELLRTIMGKSNAHVIAMTGSYFRGDNIPILLYEDESKFTRITYNYYEQLNGYTYLKSLGIGYHFYQGRYTAVIDTILDTNKKTILHIPNVQSGESTKDKHNEVDTILDKIGTVMYQDETTGLIHLNRHVDGKIVKIADLVDDRPRERERIVNYLRQLKYADDLDLIIALGMAKEGFDWPFCEHTLTVGYRGSLTEIIQIIGRCTRDSSNKTHAQFTNLIAQPDAADDQVKLSVNNMLKAITCSLLMEQVLAPNFKFKSKYSDDDCSQNGEIKIRGFKEPSSKRVKDIIEGDLNDLKATILQDDTIIKALPGNVEPEVINKVMIPKIIKIRYPELNDQEIEEVRQHIVVDSIIKNGEVKEIGDKKFIHMADQFINIDDLHIDLIDQINPFQRAFEILSKSITTRVLKTIQESIEASHIQMSLEEASTIFPKINLFVKTQGKEPNLNSLDALERRMAQALAYLRQQCRAKGV